MALAQRAGLAVLAGEHVRIGHRCGVNADLKVAGIVAGMAAGADSIDDLDVLRHGAMPGLFGGVRAPSTLGSFLRSFSWGSARRVAKVSRLLLAELARRTPVQPFGTTGEPSEGAPTTAAITSRSSSIAAMSPMADCLSFTPSLRA